MDQDLTQMNRGQLIEEVKKLRDAIRLHRDSQGHDLCWYHPEMWSLLPEKQETFPQVPEWSEFMQRCTLYRKSLECPTATSQVDPERIKSCATMDK